MGAILSHKTIRAVLGSKNLVRRKTIFFVATTPFAVNAFLLTHILALAKRYEVVLCVNKYAYPLTKDLVNNLEIVDIRIERKISLWSDFMALMRLWRLLNDRSPDVVHSITPKAGLLAMLAARMAGVQRRYHTFTGQVWANKVGLRRVILKKIDRMIVGLASDLFVDSESQRQMLYRENLVEPGGIEMLGGGSISGVDLQRFNPDPVVKDKKRREVGSSFDVCVFLFLGRLTRDKGAFDLVEAFRQVAIDVSEVELWVVGPDEDDLLSSLKLAASDCDAPIRWFEPTLYPDEFMVAADVLLLPSYREGFGSVIIEGAACELPAIAYRVDGVIDAIKEGYSGILTDVGDVAAFAAAMKSIAVDKDLRLRLGRQARGRAEQYFNSEDVTEAWLDWYRKALD